MQSSALPRRAAIGRKTLSARVTSWLFLVLITGICAVQQTQAQSLGQSQTGSDFRVEVQVVNQSDRERSSAYWLAFDRVLRQQVETSYRLSRFSVKS